MSKELRIVFCPESDSFCRRGDSQIHGPMICVQRLGRSQDPDDDKPVEDIYQITDEGVLAVFNEVREFMGLSGRCVYLEDVPKKPFKEKGMVGNARHLDAAGGQRRNLPILARWLAAWLAVGWWLVCLRVG